MLGASLREALTGDDQDPNECDATAYPPDMPAELVAIVEIACSVDPSARYASAGAFRRALEEFLAHEGSRAAARRARALTTSLEGAVSTVDVADPDGVLEVQRLGAATRSAWEHALAGWADSPVARRGLTQSLAILVRFHCRSENVPAARALVAEMDTVPSDLTTEIDALEARLLARARSSEVLEELREDQRIRGNDWGRSLGALANGVIVSGLLLTWSALIRAGILTFSHLAAALLATGCGVGTIVFAFIYRRALSDTRLWRIAVEGIALVCLSVALAHLYGDAAGASQRQIAIVDILLGLSVMLVSAVVISDLYRVSAIVTALALAGALIFEGYEMEALALGSLLTACSAAWYVRPVR